MSLPSGTGPVGYLAAFVALLQRLEITTASGSMPMDAGIAHLVELIASLKTGGGKAFLIGNGGSAAIVSHMHNDLCKSVGLRAIAFNDVPLLTAVANDDGYHAVFYRSLDLWADRDDMLIAISSSGESENIVRAATLAREKGCRLVTFTGFKPTNRLRQLGDVNVYVPASMYGYVEMTHSLIVHCVTDLSAALTAARV